MFQPPLKVLKIQVAFITIGEWFPSLLFVVYWYIKVNYGNNYGYFLTIAKIKKYSKSIMLLPSVFRQITRLIRPTKRKAWWFGYIYRGIMECHMNIQNHVYRLTTFLACLKIKANLYHNSCRKYTTAENRACWWPLLLTWFNFNPSRDKESHAW